MLETAEPMMIRSVVSVAAAALLCIAMPALAAGQPAVVATVTATPDEVTRSRPASMPPQTSFAAYRVKITNNGQSTIDQLLFFGATQVSGSAEKATFAESIGAGCTALDTTKTTIKCALGSLHGHGGSVSFTVLFKAPTSGEKIAFTSKAIFSSGHTGIVTTLTRLAAPDPNEVKTFVPSGGGTIFTGTSNVASAADPATTTVTVPKAASAEVVESINPQSCAADLLACFSSDLTIPGQFANLVIKLRRDVSTLGKHAKIRNAKIFYAADGIHFAEVPECDCTYGPAPGKPCIESRKAYTKKNAPSYDFVGDWEFIILATDNGRYNW